MGQYLFLLLILACPLMMIFMMRGMHGGHGAGGSHMHGVGDQGPGMSDPNVSVDELRRQRDELDRQIEQREADEQTTVASGWR